MSLPIFIVICAVVISREVKNTFNEELNIKSQK